MNNKTITLPITFWEDNRQHSFLEMSFFLRLKTNRKAKQSLNGKYKISYRDMMYYSNLDKAKVVEIINYLVQQNKINYEGEKKELTILE